MKAQHFLINPEDVSKVTDIAYSLGGYLKTDTGVIIDEIKYPSPRKKKVYTVPENKVLISTPESIHVAFKRLLEENQIKFEAILIDWL
jgi:hypothetical protein